MTRTTTVRGATAATVRAQAKMNLFLRILAREENGYHQLETLYQRLDLADDVRVRVGPDVRGRSLDVTGTDAEALGPTERNLAWRAATAYADATGWPDAFAIELTKAIPIGGGLGGGSADAGGVLRCLNALAPDPLHASDLFAIAGALGADVPFLTAESPLALAWGRGDRMLALPPLPVRRAHLAVFAEGVVTAEAYAALAALRATRQTFVRPILWTADRLTRWDDVALVAVNDFEDAIFAEREDIVGVRNLFGDVAREVERRNLDPDEDDAAVIGTSPRWDRHIRHARGGQRADRDHVGLGCDRRPAHAAGRRDGRVGGQSAAGCGRGARDPGARDADGGPRCRRARRRIGCSALAPSFNGRTLHFGCSDRGSNPRGAISRVPARENLSAVGLDADE